jgi:hypothetical protein
MDIGVVRVVHCPPDKDELLVMANDILSHREDTEYAARSICRNTDAKYHYIITCEKFLDAPKERDVILQQIGEAFRRGYGGEPRKDTPYVLTRVLANQ